jgi:mannose-1-phosphate guanylyltransferase
MKIIPVIMAGGAGTRLWPLSREDKPKQFHNLSGEGTLLAETVKRVMPLKPENIIVVTSKNYGEMSRIELEKGGMKGTVLCEPCPRNTAAAVLYAASYLKKTSHDSIIISLPADHYIKNNAEFIRILNIAIEQAADDKLVAIGIKPSYPETGYGYIHALEDSGEVRNIDKFVEKPDLERAKKFCGDGSYFWNSGIFVWKTSIIDSKFEKLMPDFYNAFKPIASSSIEDITSLEGKPWELKHSVFSKLPSISIDYGILENADKRVVIPAEFGWADLGSWKAIDDILEPDSDMNRSPNHDKAIFLRSKSCSVFSENCRISVVGLSNVVVVEAGNEILVIDKDSSQEVKKIVEMIKTRK